LDGAGSGERSGPSGGGRGAAGEGRGRRQHTHTRGHSASSSNEHRSSSAPLRNRICHDTLALPLARSLAASLALPLALPRCEPCLAPRLAPLRALQTLHASPIPFLPSTLHPKQATPIYSSGQRVSAAPATIPPTEGAQDRGTVDARTFARAHTPHVSSPLDGTACARAQSAAMATSSCPSKRSCSAAPPAQQSASATSKPHHDRRFAPAAPDERATCASLGHSCNR